MLRIPVKEVKTKLFILFAFNWKCCIVAYLESHEKLLIFLFPVIYTETS